MLTLTICVSGCSLSDSPTTLPAAPQTGRGIFACYVDGIPFIDNTCAPNAISFNCFYQYVNGGYDFEIDGRDSVENLKAIVIGSNNIVFTQGNTYQLKKFETNSVWRSEVFFEYKFR
ncbi:hypothetical protein [Flavobacterium sp.]|uniref:hypothetical protein n=1 Tax=Flavobacterium sp. TaxID=239 RepID=UPI0025E2055C|nr:hypothetical protein [Flavobacterium sp.]